MWFSGMLLSLHTVSPGKESVDLPGGKTGLESRVQVLQLCNYMQISFNSVESQLPYLYKWGSHFPCKVIQRIK